MDLAVKGLWPLLIGMLNICDMKLKTACLTLMSAMLSRNCWIQQRKLQMNYINLLFTLVKNLIISPAAESYEDDLINILSKSLKSLWKGTRHLPGPSAFCDQESLSTWSRLLDSKNFRLLVKGKVIIILAGFGNPS